MPYFLTHPPKEILSIIGLCLDITGFLFLGIEIIANDKFFELYDREKTKIRNGKKTDSYAFLRLANTTAKAFSKAIYFVVIFWLLHKYNHTSTRYGRVLLSVIILVPISLLFNLIKSQKHNSLQAKILLKPLYYIIELLYIPALIIELITLFITEKIISPVIVKVYLYSRTINQKESNEYFKKTSYYGILLVVAGFIFQALYYLI